MKVSSTFKIVLSALFASLICVATMMVQISIPATGGYANLGDGVILISAFIMPPQLAVIAAGLGSFLADLLAGYASYAFGTLIIKAGVALIASALYRKFSRNEGSTRTWLSMAVSCVIAEVFMVLGYFAYEALVLGLGVSAAGAIVGNLCQAAVGIIVACAVTPALRRSREINEIMRRF